VLAEQLGHGRILTVDRRISMYIDGTIAIYLRIS